MSAEVIKFFPGNAAKDPDHVLGQAVGEVKDVLILGWDQNGDLFAACNDDLVDAGKLMWLMECFRHELLVAE